MGFEKLSSNSKQLLDEIIAAENPSEMLRRRFEGVSQREDAELRGIIRELRALGYINVKWADNVPYYVVINNCARTYNEQLKEYETRREQPNLNISNHSKIFISHRSTDAPIADALFDFFIATGIQREKIFCSSLPGNDVKEKISVEVRETMKNSCLNIAILSNEYYKSAYCLNEAGILWFQDVPVIPIALPEIQPVNMIGFLNDDYKIRRLDNADDLAYVYDTACEVTSSEQAKAGTVTAETRKLMDKYQKLLSSRVQGQKLKENAVENTSKLKLLGIDESGKLCDDASIYPFVLNSETTMAQYIEIIKGMYEQVAKISLEPKRNAAFTGFNFATPVEIDTDEQSFLRNVAEELKIEIPDNFFVLGNLEKNTLSSNILTGPKLNGTKEEKEKYWKIKKLHETVSKALEWAPVEKAFLNKQCIRLAIQNCGKAIDEDVEISFEIPKKAFFTLDEFPRFNNAEMGYMINDCNMYILFGIGSTAEYIDYSESERRSSSHPSSHPCGLPGYTPDYNDDFIEELNDVFCYSVYDQDDKYIIKLKVDYIKHNTTVAFPTIIFIKDKVDEIPYKITSKNNPNIIEDVIKVL